MMRYFLKGPIVTMAAVLVSFGLSFPSPARDIAVDLELVLAVDVSGSVDEVEAGLQRDGYVQALRHPDVVKAILSGILQRIAVAYVEWAGEPTQTVVIGWRLIDSEGSAYALSKDLDGAPIARGRFTSIHQAIRFALPMFGDNGFDGTRKVIDVSGDGPNNTGGLVTIARDLAVAQGVTINGLPIVNDRPNRFGPQMTDLDLYYRNCVIGGPGAFIVVARDFRDFARAVRRKLVLEIAGVPAVPLGLDKLRRVAYEGPPCDAGERRLQRRFLNRY